MMRRTPKNIIKNSHIFFLRRSQEEFPELGTSAAFHNPQCRVRQNPAHPHKCSNQFLDGDHQGQHLEHSTRPEAKLHRRHCWMTLPCPRSTSSLHCHRSETPHLYLSRGKKTLWASPSDNKCRSFLKKNFKKS